MICDLDEYNLIHVSKNFMIEVCLKESVSIWKRHSLEREIVRYPNMNLSLTLSKNKII